MTSSEEDGTDHPISFHEKLQALERAIWARRPILGQIMAEHATTTLFDYTQKYFEVEPSPLLDRRKCELIRTAEQLITERLGQEAGARVAKQLARLPLVSTTDHHGPIDHPFFVNANIISAIPYLKRSDAELDDLVVFSFASVSVNNASAYPRGILFHGSAKNKHALIRLPILPDKVKMGVVYGMRPFTRDELTRAEHVLHKKMQNGDVDQEDAERITYILETCFGTDDVLATSDFASQITKVNYALWPMLFKEEERWAASPSKHVSDIPNLIYLDIESLVTRLLLEYHFTNPDSLLYRTLFSRNFRERALLEFNNIPGAFSVENKWGTFMFWAMDHKLHRVGLLLDGDTLRSPEGEFAFPFTPEGIREALESKKILPSMLLCYLTVALYYGMKCLGGFSQVHDLTMVKFAWERLLRESGEKDEAQALAPVKTNELGGDGMVLAYLNASDGAWFPATGIDMAISDTDTTHERYVEFAKQVSVGEMMNPMLPEVYSVLYSQDQRDSSLAVIQAEEIVEVNGFKEKVRAHFGAALEQVPPTEPVSAASSPMPTFDAKTVDVRVSLPASPQN